MRLAQTTTREPEADRPPVPSTGPRPSAAPRRPAKVHVVDAPGGYALRLRDLWRYRGLLRYFGKLYVKRRYRRTWLGWIWVPLRPAYDIAGRILLFGGLLNVPSGTRPYFMFFIVGAAAWRFLSIGVIQTTRALDVNRGLFARLNLPRMTAVAAALVPATIEAGIFALIGILGSIYFKFTQGSFYLDLSPGTLLAVLGMLLLAVYVFALGLIVAPLSYHARDVRYLVSYVLGFWYVVTPIIYPISALSSSLQNIAVYNPLTAPVEMVKYGILQTAPPEYVSVVVSLVFLALLLLVGTVTFARGEARSSAAV